MLEEKIRHLETKIDAIADRDPTAQPTPKPSSTSTPALDSRQQLLAHPLFLQDSGEIERPPRRVAALLPYFPHPIWVDRAHDVWKLDAREAYSSVIQREIVETAVARWDPVSQDMPLDVSEHLSVVFHQSKPASHFILECRIRMFLPYRSHFMFYMDLSRFMVDVRLPASHPRSIHPALLNVIYLYSSSLAGGYLASYQAHFLVRARRELEASLAYADRLPHFLWASVLLGMYYVREG